MRSRLSGFALMGLFASTPVLRAQEPMADPSVQFAHEVEATIARRDASFLDGSFDRNAFYDRITGGIDAPDGFARGFRSSFDKSFTFGERVLMTALKDGGTYQFLRIRENPKRALFRLVSGEGALNYHELELVRTPSGAVGVQDVYVYTTGEYLSETVKRIYLSGVAQANRGFLERLQGKDELLIKHLEEVQTMSQAMQSGEGAKALSIYRALPPELQRQKIILLTRIGAAAQVDDTEYERAMAAYQEAFPRAPELALIVFDRYFLKGEYAKVLELLDQLETSVGGDPYLDVLRSSTFTAAGDLQRARAVSEKAVAAAPDMENAYFALLNVGLAFDEHALTADTLDRLSERFGYTWQLEGQPDYASFLASDEGKRWLQSNRQ